MKAQTAESRLALDAMAVEELLKLRERVDRLISERISTEEQELETRLARLKRLRLSPATTEGQEERAAPVRSTSRKLPVRYRNPADPRQAWAGRGLQPRWLKQALKSGRKLSEFLVLDTD